MADVFHMASKANNRLRFRCHSVQGQQVFEMTCDKICGCSWCEQGTNDPKDSMDLMGPVV